MPRCPDDEDEDAPFDAAEIVVEIEPPEVLGHLLGPDGEPIATLLARRPIPFGFQPPEVMPCPTRSR